MRRTILVADDEAPVRRVVARALEGAYAVLAAADGQEALDVAAARRPDLILLDVQMPRRTGWEVLSALRAGAATRLTPVIILTSGAEVSRKVEGLSRGADDYVTKPFAGAELRARVDGLLRRHELALGANPLTGLPGNAAIEAEAVRRLAAGEPFAFFHADVDRFKAFNDACGIAAGDEVLRTAARCLREALGPGFSGHVGGDDFAAMCALAEAPHAAQRLAAGFDEAAPALVPESRRGLVRAPTLSIAVASSARPGADSYGRLCEIAGEIKSFLKAESGRALSRFMFDRRTGR
ncbi:MAG: response regulator [Elusimicrobiota bacterium]|nr:MAG: response regulator [Elusimicrobiota bacterium]